VRWNTLRIAAILAELVIVDVNMTIEELAREYLAKEALLPNNGLESSVIGKTAVALYKRHFDRAKELGATEGQWLNAINRVTA